MLTNLGALSHVNKVLAPNTEKNGQLKIGKSQSVSKLRKKMFAMNAQCRPIFLML